MYGSTDSGLSWLRADSTGPPLSGASHIFPLSDNDLLAVVPGVGTYRSFDGAAHWDLWGSGMLDSMYVTGFARDKFGFVYAGGNDGIARLAVPLLSVGPESPFPRDILLLQNYPNPFNPSTTMGFTLATRTKVALKVYDVLGEEVATVVDAVLDAGNHRV